MRSALERKTVRLRRFQALAAGAALAGGLAAGPLQAQPVGTAFTYQGRLTDAGNPANGSYDLQFALFDAASGGAQVGPTLTRDDVVVTNGLFTVSLDFATVFTGNKRWLELGVRPGASTGAFTTLAGRQELSPSPNAVFSATSPWTGISGKPPGFADDTDNDALGALSCPNGQIAKRVAGVWACADDNDAGGDITAVTAGTGLTGGGTSGAVTVSASLAGSGTANTLARSDHDHFSQSWSGSTATGLTITNSGGTALRGLTTGTATNTPAIYGEFGGSIGYGVYGNATSTTVGTFPIGVLGASVHGNGVYGVSQDGIGVTGGANSQSGFTTGVLGTALSPDGTGVYGQAGATNGFAIGVRGDTYSPAGIAVWGYSVSTAATGSPIGVEGRSDSPVGIGVNGFAASPTGANFGVRGGSNSPNGTGVIGSVTATTGFARGVYGESASSAGVGVYGLNSAVGGIGLQGASGATSGSGVGVRAITNAPNGSGLFASAQGANAGQNFGVWGETSSTQGVGIHGQAWSTSGFANGVWGRSYSTVGNGVVGQAMATTGQAWGVFGTSPSVAGVGVYGISTPTAAASTGVGVWGRTGATGGFGGYFENSSGGPALGVSAGGIRFSDGTTQTTASAGDITGVTAGIGLTGGAASGNATLSANFGGSGSSSQVAREDHDHIGNVWSGPGGLYLDNTSPGLPGFWNDTLFVTVLGSQSRAILGYATPSSGQTVGVWGQSDSTTGFGVLGYAPAVSGVNYGVYGRSDSPSGYAGFFEGYQVAIPNGKLTFAGPGPTRQLIDLRSPAYGIGQQGGVLYFRTEPPGGNFTWFLGGSHSDVQNDPGPGGFRQMRLDGGGNLFVRGSYFSGGADFAEMLPARDGLEPGDVLVIGPDGRLVLSTSAYQDTLAGVYSTKPGLVGGAADGESTEGKVPLAVTGIVPVKVTDEGGPIVPGDALTSSSTPGHAMKAAKVRVGGIAFFPSGVVIGKAIEPLHSGTGVIRALVVLQ